MERDRWNYLALRAYVRGALSFQRSGRQDDRWRLKEEIVLGEMERELSAELHKLVHEAEASAAQYVSQEVFTHHYEKAKKEYSTVAGLLRPYIEAGVAAGLSSEDLLALWENEFGALDSPEVQEELRKLEEDTKKKVKHDDGRQSLGRGNTRLV